MWGTEGHFHHVAMGAYLAERRRAYGRQMGMHDAADDFQYGTDCAVRFMHIGELMHRPWGRGLDHLRQVLTDHSPFPRGVCRHAGPDTDPYDCTVTQHSSIFDITHNCAYERFWSPWKRFACEVSEVVTQYPPRPCDE